MDTKKEEENKEDQGVCSVEMLTFGQGTSVTILAYEGRRWNLLKKHGIESLNRGNLINGDR